MPNPNFWVNFTSFIPGPKKEGKIIMRTLDKIYGDISAFVCRKFKFAAKWISVLKEKKNVILKFLMNSLNYPWKAI